LIFFNNFSLQKYILARKKHSPAEAEAHLANFNKLHEELVGHHESGGNNNNGPRLSGNELRKALEKEFRNDAAALEERIIERAKKGVDKALGDQVHARMTQFFRCLIKMKLNKNKNFPGGNF
jgi:hypothetical protein